MQQYPCQTIALQRDRWRTGPEQCADSVAIRTPKSRFGQNFEFKDRYRTFHAPTQEPGVDYDFISYTRSCCTPVCSRCGVVLEQDVTSRKSILRYSTMTTDQPGPAPVQEISDP
ncbi:UNVERIFIED_CONTAM: hypothetical protein Slati_4264500 [Sesamum latifolium]|uniref:Uncharacterized protein n=1 Tax=Sesamum latifolium TaxID=2727402 RepID=A0AAW2TFP1_9LAMI